MAPISFENLAEQNCLTNLSQPIWPINFNYWIGGTQEDKYGQFYWCLNQSAVYLDANLIWANNTPDYKTVKNCLQMKYVKTNTSIALQILNRNCSDKFVSACEVPFFNNCCMETKM
jgi:hypothetical protein